MACLLGSGNPIEIVVLPMLIVVVILAAGLCLVVCVIALILALVLMNRRPTRPAFDPRDRFSSGSPGTD